MIITLITATTLHFWPTTQGMYARCMKSNLNGVPRYLDRTRTETHEYCKCQATEIMKAYKHTKLMPEVVLEHLLLQIDLRCNRTKRA